MEDFAVAWGQSPAGYSEKFPKVNDPASSQFAPTRQAVLLLAFMWFAYFLNYCDRQAVFSMFPVLKSDLGFTDNQLGLVGASFLWVYGVGSFFAGQIGDNFSKRRLIVWARLVRRTAVTSRA